MRTKIASIPDAIRNWKAWAVMKIYQGGGGELQKIPIAPDDGKEWNSRPQLLTLEEAYLEAHSIAEAGEHHESEGLVLALRLPEDERLVVVDCDVDSEVPIESLPERLQNLGAGYVEQSISGLGLHALGYADLERELTKSRITDRDNVSVEIYTQNRLIIFTGNIVDGQADICELNQEYLETIVRDLREHTPPAVTTDSSKPDDFRPEESLSGQISITGIGAKSARRWSARTRGKVPTVSTESPTVEMVKRTACVADDKFEHLWNGGSLNKPSASEADCALVSKLVFWCRGDIALIDECFRASARYGIRPTHQEPKWDSDRGGQTWGVYTIKKALKENPHRYAGKYLHDVTE